MCATDPAACACPPIGPAPFRRMARTSAPDAARTVSPPTALARRFEAIVFGWEGTAVADRHTDAGQLRRVLERLCALGAFVAVVDDGEVEALDAQLGARPAGP